MGVDRRVAHAIEAVAEDAITEGSGTGKECGLGENWTAAERLKHLSGGNGRPSVEEISKLFNDGAKLDYIVPMLEDYLKSVSQLRLSHQRALKAISEKLANSLSSLPDGLLALVFQFTVTPCEDLDGCDGSPCRRNRQAIAVSHVSKRFRRVALGVQNLWTTLHCMSSTDELKTFISRSGLATDIRLVVSFPLYNSPRLSEKLTIIHNFFKACLSTASRWVSLTMDSHSDITDGDGLTADDILTDIFRLYQLVLPRLHTFRVLQYRCDTCLGENTWIQTRRFIPSWRTPNLRVIKCDGYIPLPSNTYSAVDSFATTFDLAHIEHPSLVLDLLQFLDGTPTIRKFELGIFSLMNIMQPLALTRTHCSYVTSFELRLTSFRVPDGTRMLLRPLIKSLNMPKLVNYTASVEVRYGDIVDGAEDILRETVLFLLPDPTTHPNLATICLDFTHTKGDGFNADEWRAIRICDKSTIIPLDKLPYVSDLTVRTFGDIRLERSAGGNGDGYCSLRRLHVLTRRNDSIEAVDVDNIVDDLKNVGAWESLETLALDSRPYFSVDDKQWDGKVKCAK